MVCFFFFDISNNVEMNAFFTFFFYSVKFLKMDLQTQRFLIK